VRGEIGGVADAFQFSPVKGREKKVNNLEDTERREGSFLYLSENG